MSLSIQELIGYIYTVHARAQTCQNYGFTHAATFSGINREQDWFQWQGEGHYICETCIETGMIKLAPSHLLGSHVISFEYFMEPHSRVEHNQAVTVSLTNKVYIVRICWYVHFIYTINYTAISCHMGLVQLLPTFSGFAHSSLKWWFHVQCIMFPLLK